MKTFTEQTLDAQLFTHRDDRDRVKFIKPPILQQKKLKIENRPEVFFKGCESLLKNNEILRKSDSALVSAMVMFGKTTGSSALRSSATGVKKIPVQPLSVGRRTAYLGGRNTQLTGRPSAAMNHQVSEHNFAMMKQSAKVSWAVPPSRLPRSTAPHSLSTCVDRRVPLGKTHSKK